MTVAELNVIPEKAYQKKNTVAPFCFRQLFVAPKLIKHGDLSVLTGGPSVPSSHDG